MKARLLPHQFKWSWLVAAGVLAFYLALAAVFPRPIEAAQNVLAERPGGSIMTGVLAIMLVVPLTLLLVLSVVGTVVVPFLACGFLTAFWLGKAAVYRMVGQQLGRNTGLACLQNPVVAVAAGVIIFLVVATIPFLGFIAWGALAPLAIGSVLLAAFPRSKPRLETPATPIPPVIPGVPAPLHPVPASSALLPRAGFWWRTFGTLLDFVILVAILKILRFPKPVGIFIPIWLIYQLALWTWNGATVGGLILGMRIIRTDGLSIGFPVALVRLLSSFLSALAFFLGFFWAGWDGQKQSWHDKIAGTLVVRTPRVARQVAT